MSAKRDEFQLPKKGSPERISMQKEYQQMKKEHVRRTTDDSLTPPGVSMLLLASSLPQTAALYSMIWNDVLSDNFFLMFDISFGWIAILASIEGAAG